MTRWVGGRRHSNDLAKGTEPRSQSAMARTGTLPPRSQASGFPVHSPAGTQKASQEVEDIRAVQERQPLTRKPGQAPDAFKRIRVDTWLGMAFSNLVALAIYHSGDSASHRRCGHRDGRGIASRASSPSPCSPWASSGRDCCPCQCSQGLPLMRSARRDAGRSGSREGQSTPKHSTPLLRSRCLAARRSILRLSWAESASDPENREAFFTLARPGKAPPPGSRDRPPRPGSGQPANLRSVGRPRVNGPRWTRPL